MWLIHISYLIHYSHRMLKHAVPLLVPCMTMSPFSNLYRGQPPLQYILWMLHRRPLFFSCFQNEFPNALSLYGLIVLWPKQTHWQSAQSKTTLNCFFFLFSCFCHIIKHKNANSLKPRTFLIHHSDVNLNMSSSILRKLRTFSTFL